MSLFAPQRSDPIRRLDVVRFTMKRDWPVVTAIDARCERAMRDGVIVAVDRHHDVIADTISYSITYPKGAS